MPNKVYICGATISHEDLEVGQLHKGKIVAKVKQGFLVRLSPILKGLLKFIDCKKEHNIGDEVIVKVIDVRPELKEIDLIEEIVENPEEERIEKDIETRKIVHVKEMNELVKVKGQVINITISGPTIFTITDGSSIIWVSCLEEPGIRAYPEVNIGDYIEVIGYTTYYAEKPQIMASYVRKLNENEVEELKEIIEKNLEEISTPKEIKFLIESETLEKLKDRMINAAKLIKKAIYTGTPILIRHHYDCDGTCGGLALEMAISEIVKEVNPNPEAVWHYIVRKPIKAPYYHEEDVVKDIVFSFEDNLRFNQKLPLIIVVDNGSGSEDIPAYKRLKELGFDIIVVDHHKPDLIEDGKSTVDEYLLEHINPRLFGLSGEFTAGMLATELAILVNPNIREKVSHLPAIAGTGDRSEHPDYEKYLEIAKNKGLELEDLKKIAEVFDYEAYYMKFMAGRGFVERILGVYDVKFSKEYANKIYEIVKERQERQLNVVLPHVKEVNYGDLKVIYIDVEKFAYKFEYPAPGKTVGLVHDYYKNKYKGPIVSVGHGPDFIILRANEKSVELGFDVIKLCKFLEEKVPDAGVLGGGHEDAGSIKFIEGRKDKIMKSLDVYFKTLMNINRD